VQLQLSDGRTVLRSTVASRGTPENPWGEAEIVGKFRRNASPIIGADRAAELVDLVPKLAQMKDAGKVARLCRRKDRA
jgi:hypothetical protein